MMRPQYANALTVSFNLNLDEVVIDFIHEYPMITQDASPETMQEQGKSSDDICSVVLPSQLAHKLYDAIGKGLELNAEQSK